MANMTAEEFLEKVEQLTGSKATFDPKNIDDFQKHIKAFTENLKRHQPVLKGFGDFLDGTKQPIQNVVREMDELNRAIKDAKKSRNAERVDELESNKADLKKTAITKNVSAGLSNLGIGIGSLAQTIYEGTRDFAKSLQSGASGVEAATKASLKTIDATVATSKALGGVAETAGFIIALMGPWGRAIGLVVAGLGKLGEFLVGKSAEKLKDGIEFLGDELKKTQAGFKDITSAGAIFAGGMTEMRQEAARAGLDIAQLATVVKNAREDFVNMGIGLGEATRRIGGISRELRNSQLGIQLRNLGYGAEEQAELAAQVMARQNAAGDRRALSDRQIAEITMQYGKELRIISDITGQDAKKAMEKAGMQALEVDVLAKAEREGGAEGYKKMQGILATMQESAKKGFMETYTVGASADTAFRLAIANNPRLNEQIDRQIALVRDRNISTEQANLETGKLSEQSLKYARENPGIFENIGIATRSTGQYAEITAYRNKELQEGLQRQVGAAEKARKNADEMANNVLPLDKAVQGLEEDTNRLRSALGATLLTPLTKFAETTAAGVDTIEKALKKLGLGPKTVDNPIAKNLFNEDNKGILGSLGRAYNKANASLVGKSYSGDAAPAPTGAEPDRTVSATGLKLKAGAEDKGKAEDKLYEMAQQVHKMLGGDYRYFSGFNDRDGNSAHASGRAFDLVLNDSSKYASTLAQIKSLDQIQFAQFEKKGQKNPNGSVATGDHIHAEVKAAQGAVVPATTGGVNVKVAEGGASEVIAPLKNGRLPGMDEMIERLDQMISVMKDQRDTSEKIFNATA
jgi:hypothetical protein